MPYEDFSSYELLIIPEGLKKLTVESIENSGERLILYIPSSIEEIDAEILEHHELIIISDFGTVAETFAREYDVKFLAVKKNS